MRICTLPVMQCLQREFSVFRSKQERLGTLCFYAYQVHFHAAHCISTCMCMQIQHGTLYHCVLCTSQSKFEEAAQLYKKAGQEQKVWNADHTIISLALNVAVQLLISHHTLRVVCRL